MAAALIAGGAVAVMLTQRLVQKAAGEQQAAAAERVSAQSKLDRATDEERDIRDRLVDYRKLLDRGVIGEEQRLNWVDRIGEIKTARKLFDVRYSIDVREPVDYPGLAGAGDVELMASPMKLEMSLLHEEDLFRFLDDLRGALSAYVVVKSCSLQRSQRAASERGLVPAARRELRDRSRHDPRPQDGARMSATAAARQDTPRAAARVLFVLALAAGAGVSAPRPAAADELGRLFFTPRQHQELDRRRASNVQEKEEVVVESSVTVNGHVARSSGKTTTWVNGVPQYDTYSGRDPARVHLQDGTVKIGQTLDRTRGEVKDGLEGGSVRVNPKPPPPR